MNTLRNFVLFLPIVVLFSSCNVTTPKEVKVSHEKFNESMNIAVDRSAENVWNSVEKHTRAAWQILPKNDLTNAEDGNYAYLSLQARALEAYSYLADGKAEDAKRKYETLFNDLKSYEQCRAQNFENELHPLACGKRSA